MTRFFYGYWIVVAGFITLVVSNGLAYYGFSVMNAPVAAYFGWSRGQVTLGFTCLAVAMALSSALVGRLTDNRGPRQVLIIGTALLSLSLILLSRISSLWSYYLLHCGLGMALAFLGAVPISVIISNWFHRWRGTMQGLSFIGIGFGGFVFGPVIGNYLIPNLGWSKTYAVMALLSVAIMALVLLFLVRNHPREKGLSPYGAEATGTDDDSVSEARKVVGLRLKEAVGKSAFWLIALTSAVYGMGLTGGLQNLVSILTWRGFTAGEAASAAAFAVGIVGLCSAIGKFTFGYLCDRIDPKYTTAIAYALTGLSLIALMLAGSVHDIWLFGIFLGLGMGGWAPNMAMLVGKYFGMRHYGAILGNIHLIFMLGEAIAPVVVGLVYDQAHTYYLVLFILSVLCLASIIPIIIARKPSLTLTVENIRQT